MSDTSTALLVVRVGPSPANGGAEEVLEKMKTAVQGTLTPLDSLADVTDWVSVRKVRSRLLNARLIRLC